MRASVRASVRPSVRTDGRTDARTDARTDDLPLPACACRNHKLFKLGDPSVTLASQELQAALHGRGASVARPWRVRLAILVGAPFPLPPDSVKLLSSNGILPGTSIFTKRISTK